MSESEKSYKEEAEDEQNRNDNMSDQDKKIPYVVPNSKTKLRACLHCKLIKTEDQWKSNKNCENCGVVNNVESETTQKFNGIISIMNEGQSWVRRKKRLAKPRLVLGAYAIKFNN